MKEYTREDVNAGWPSWAKIGAKVVLIDGLNSIDGRDKVHLEGDVFIIIEMSDAFVEPAVRTRNAETGDENDPWTFGRLSRYRPLAAKTIEQDTALFTHLLTNLPIYELAAEEAGSNVDRVDGLLLALNACWTRYGEEE